MTDLRCWAFAHETKEGERLLSKFDGFEYESTKALFWETFPGTKLIYEQEVPSPSAEPINWANVLYWWEG